MPILRSKRVIKYLEEMEDYYGEEMFPFVSLAEENATTYHPILPLEEDKNAHPVTPTKKENRAIKKIWNKLKTLFFTSWR